MEPRNNNLHKVGIVVVVLMILVWFGYYVSQNSVPANNIGYNSAPITPVTSVTPPKNNVTSPLAPAAVDGTQIEITGCVAKPAAINVKLNGSLKFVNRDPKAHVIIFGPKDSFVSTAYGEKIIDLKFLQTLGVNKFSCDGKLDTGTVNIVK